MTCSTPKHGRLLLFLLTLVAALIFSQPADAQVSTFFRFVEVEDLSVLEIHNTDLRAGIYIVTDPVDDTDCDPVSGGGGSADPHICYWNGTAWTVVGSGGGGGGVTNAEWLTLASHASLSQERVFTLGFGLAGADGGANSTYTLGFDASDPGASPSWSAGQCRFSTTTGKFIACEGATADAFELFIAVADPTGDRTLTIPNADSAPGQAVTCSSTDKVSAFSATTGAFTCTADVGITATSTDVLQNKTLDVEATGNVITITTEYVMTPAQCHSTIPYLLWSHTATNYPTAACATGTNTQQAYADFSDTTDQCLQAKLPLSSGWTGAIDVTYKWLTTATSGSVAWCTQIVCVADAETADPAFTAQASGNCVTDAAKGTTNQKNDVTDTGITTTGCAASEEMYLRTCRDPDETGGQTDTVAAAARLSDVLVVMRRAM